MARCTATGMSGAPRSIIFDAVAGGAGHAQRIAEKLDVVARAALDRVEVLPQLREETSCYTCLRSYRNQGSHEILSRAPQSDVLTSMIKVDDDAGDRTGVASHRGGAPSACSAHASVRCAAA